MEFGHTARSRCGSPSTLDLGSHPHFLNSLPVVRKYKGKKNIKKNDFLMFSRIIKDIKTNQI